jgi:phospholipid/cholesterol/gamma-HCH transport system permease protein
LLSPRAFRDKARRMFESLGRSVISLLVYLGEVAHLAAETMRSMLPSRIRWRLVLNQLLEMGARSQLVVIVTGAFTGAVFAAQTFFQFHRLGMDSAVGSVVSVSLFRELGPVLTGLMVAGRVGASIAAEIGTMKVTEQVDALRSLSVHPVDYLVVPRAIAMMVAMPLLVAECCAFGILFSYVVGVQVMGIPEASFVNNIIYWTKGKDVSMSLIKAFFFGIIIVLVSCHQGLKAENGAAGVGRAPTEAVVIGSLAVLGANFILTFALNFFFAAD